MKRSLVFFLTVIAVLLVTIMVKAAKATEKKLIGMGPVDFELSSELSDLLTGTGSVFTFSYNPNTSDRDEFLTPYKMPLGDFGEYCLIWDIDHEALEFLIEKKWVDPNDNSWSSANVREIYLFLKRWPVARAGGRAWNGKNPRIRIDSLSIPSVGWPEVLLEVLPNSVTRQIKQEFAKLANSGYHEHLDEHFVHWD